MSNDMTFNWKMKPNNKLTVTMFSPDNFKNSVKPQKVVSSTIPSISIQNYDSKQNVGLTSYTKPGTPAVSSKNSNWEFHSDGPQLRPRAPPLKKLISAPGNLQQYTQSGTMNSVNINQFHHHNQKTTKARHRVRAKKLSGRFPPLITSQNSSPEMLSLVSPIARKNITRKTKPQRALLTKSKLPSTSDLYQAPQSGSNRKLFVPPPLLSTNSDSSLFGSSPLPSLQAMVSGSPSNSPGNTSPYSSCSDQEMCDVEKQTSKMSIQNLIGREENQF